MSINKIKKMKTKSIKSTFIFLGLFAFSFLKAQTESDYFNFYNSIAPKLNAVANVKSNYLNNNFSLFLSKLNSENVIIDNIGYYPRNSPTENIYTIRMIA